MRIALFLLSGLFVVTSPVACGANQANTTSPQVDMGTVDPELSRLQWLTGRWLHHEDGQISEENWSAPASDAMFAVSRTIADGKTVFFEYMRIQAEPTPGGSTQLVLLASPGGRAPATRFTATQIGEQTVSFAAPEHDFPQVITYRRTGNSLSAHIEGKNADGSVKSAQWQWTRATCPGQTSLP